MFMINAATKNSRKWIPDFKYSASYFKMFNQALDNLELNKLEERTFTLALVVDEKSKKAGL
jgi:hypothetical protein